MTTEPEQGAVPEQFTYDGWAVVEIYGHRRTGGRVKPQALGPAVWIRIDVPNRGGRFTTQFYNPGSIFSLTPSGEREARAVAYANEPEPVSRWEMRALDAPAPRPHVVDAEEQRMRDAGYSDAEISGHSDESDDEPDTERDDAVRDNARVDEPFDPDRI